MTLQPDNPRPLVAAVNFYNRIVADTRTCHAVGLQPVTRTVNHQMVQALLPVLNRDICNAVANPLIQGSVFDQHMCVGEVTANAATNCNVRRVRGGFHTFVC